MSYHLLVITIIVERDFSKKKMLLLVQIKSWILFTNINIVELLFYVESFI